MAAIEMKCNAINSRTVRSPPMPPKDFYQILRASFTEVIPHARECAMAIERLDETGAVVAMPYRHEWLGDTDRGLIHTGIITTLVDTVCGLAALAAAKRFESIATLDLRMDFLRPAVPDLPLRAHAECYRLTRSISFVRARAWQGNEAEPVAVSQSTFMRGQRPGPVSPKDA
jgi:uncharacterized protein (TIGR00369 family)